MKKIFTFCVSLLAALSVFAYDFQSGDLFYNITSSSAPYTVEVTQQSQYYNSNYSGVDTIVIPETVTYNAIIYSVTSIGESAFDHSKLTTITIPNTVTSIGEYAFAYCQKLTSVAIGSGVKTIHMAAFNNCYALRTITIPANVKEIYNQAFTGASISTIYMEGTTPPSLLQSKSDGSIFRIFTTTPTCYVPCSAVASYKASTKWKGAVREFVAEFPYTFTIASANISLGTIAITQQPDCSTAAIFEAIPNTGCYFTQWSDGNTDNPRTLKVTQDTRLTASFASSTYVVNLIAGANGVVSGAGTYDHGTTATITAIPNDGYHFTQWSDGNTDNPRSIVVVEPISLTALFEENYTQEHCQIIYTSTDGDVVTPWVTYNFGADIVSNTYADGQGVITFDGPVTAIGDTAFANCSSLESIIIPDRVTVIGDQAFQYCTYLKDVTIGNRVESIGTAAFNNCSSLQSITIPQSVKYIYNYAFLGTSVKTVYVNCTNPPLLNPNREDPDLVFMTNAVNTCYIPCGKLESYQVSNWKTKSFVREFIERPSYALLVKSSNNAMGKAIITQDINCESLTAIITAIPNDGYHFIQWSDGNTDNPRSWVVTEDTYLEAIFEKSIDPTWQITYTSTYGDIVTPNNVNVFGANIVSNTYENGVGTITFDGPVTSIGENAFEYCSSLASITIPNSVTSIGNWAFWSCESLTSITIPKSVTSIGAYAFGNCRSLTSIVVEPSNTTYDSRENCNAIIEKATNTLIAGCQNTIIPNSVTSIGNNAFYGCSSLTSITIPNSVTSIGLRAFSHCYSLTSITIPNSVTSIGEYAFDYCISLSSVTLGSGVTSIGEGAFYRCTDLTSITIPESVTSIGGLAFYDCTSLNSVTLGSGVTSIGERAFGGCTSLTSITCEATTPPALESDVFPSNLTTAYIPCYTLAAYEASDWASQVSEFIEEGCPPVQKCGDNLYWSFADSTLTITGYGEMYDTEGYGKGIPWYYLREKIAYVNLPNGITSIGSWAFYESKLRTIDIPNGVTHINERAFLGCNDLESLSLPASIDSLGYLVFTGHNELKSINVDGNNNLFDTRDSCNAIIETSTNTLLYGCASTIIPSTVEKIGYGAFNNLYNLKSIVVPNNVKVIDDFAFYWCKLDFIVLPEGLIEIGDYAFYWSGRHESIVIPNSVETIGKYAFANLPHNTSITVGSGVTTIGDSAFCRVVDTVYFKALNPPTINVCPFDGTPSAPICFIPCGTLDAYQSSAWANYMGEFIEEGCIDPTWQITYTSTDGNIVTPYKTNVFGANIVSNEYKDGQGVITFDGPVTSIGEEAFRECSSLASITIPNSVTSIGKWAFTECSLTSITIPESVTSIEDYAIIACSSLTSMMVVDGNSTYDSRENCNAIIEKATNTLIAGCQKTVIPNTVTSIGNAAFARCTSLTSITIPESVTNIGMMAFRLCTSLTSVTIPESVTSIKNNAFSGCTSLTTMVVEASNPTYDSRENCNAIVEKATNTLIAGCQNTTIPNSVTSIGEDAFYECTDLTSITIPESVTSIGGLAFYGCTSLASINIPNSVTSIGVLAFSHCTSLTSVTLGSGVTSIGYGAFGGWPPFTSITCEATTPPTLGSEVFPSDLTTAYIPCGTKEAYEESDWGAYSITSFIEEGCIDPTWQILYTSTDGNVVTPNKTDVFGANIVSNEYKDGQGIITFDGPVKSIGDTAFYRCYSLSSITIPNSVTSIGNQAFHICDNLTSITIPNSVMSIGSWAFGQCYDLISISIPNSVTSIGDHAFAHCKSLASVTIPNSVTSIGEDAFFVCKALTSISIPKSVTSIGKCAFSNCDVLTSMVVESGNTTYDSREGCNAIIETATNVLIAGCKSSIIPNSVTSIGECAFGYCRSLTSITIPNSVTSIGFWAFGECSALTSITIPNSVTSIGSYAFGGCSSLTSITIPNSVTFIGSWAFSDCTSLTSITCEPTTPPTLGSTVFPYQLTTAYIPCGTKAAYEASDWAQYVSEFVEEGCAPIQKCGDNLYWEYADGVLTITGTGDMYDYAKDTDVPWYDVRGNIKTVSLPDAMTKIGQNAFYKCINMTTINMPASLISVGEKAFAQDTKLACEIILPASMTNIATRAFFNCKAVPAFHVEATTPPTVQADAFDYTTAPIHVPCGYGHIYGKHTQWGMLNLEMCELLQDNVYYYPIDGHTARAVTYQSNPTDTIVIPSAVVIDGMPRTVTEVADFAFTDCANLPAIYFNEGLEYIGERAFVRCYGLQGTIVLPATLETIGERAFSYCNSVTRYTLQSMTPPALGDGAFTCANHDALFYVSCEVMDDYKVATNWSSLKSRLRDACLNIYHYNTPLGANGVYTTEDTLVASIYYRRKFTPYRWETLYLPFEVDRVTVLEEGVEYDLTAWDIVNGGHYFLAKPDGMLNKEILFGFTDELESHTPYIIQFSDAYYTDKLITFYGKESWHKLSTSFEVLSSSSWMQIAGNTTMQDQLLEKPVYMLRSGLDFILQKTTTTLHPFECYVMPYATPSGTPARMNVRFRGDVPTDVESVKGNESHLTYTVDGYTLTVYPQGQAFSIYSLNGALIYSCEAGKEAVDCELNSGCYLLHAGAEAHKIML